MFAKVMDNCLHHVFGETYGVDYGTFPPQFVKSVSKSHSGTAGTVEWTRGSENVLSLGFLIIATIVIPIGAMNLDENMFLQWISFGGLVIFTTDFIVQVWVTIKSTWSLFCCGEVYVAHDAAIFTLV